MSDFIGCGRCCRFLGYPPFNADPHGRTYKGVFLETIEPIPEELQRERELLIRQRVEGVVEDRAAHYLPCSWYDPATGLCRHYEHRPQLCRQHDCSNREDCLITEWSRDGAEIRGCLTAGSGDQGPRAGVARQSAQCGRPFADP